jgi:hypothetical protein
MCLPVHGHNNRQLGHTRTTGDQSAFIFSLDYGRDTRMPLFGKLLPFHRRNFHQWTIRHVHDKGKLTIQWGKVYF